MGKGVLILPVFMLLAYFIGGHQKTLAAQRQKEIHQALESTGALLPDAEKKTCTVVSTEVATWQGVENMIIELPKVNVRVQGPSKIITAFMKSELLSDTSHFKYEPSAQAWADSFVTGTKIPCWQEVDNPEIVYVGDDAESEPNSVEKAIVRVIVGLFLTCFICRAAGFCINAVFRKNTDQGGKPVHPLVPETIGRETRIEIDPPCEVGESKRRKGSNAEVDAEMGHDLS